MGSPLARFVSLSLLASATLHAQDALRTGFEVASIRRSSPDAAPGRAGLQPGGRYVLSNGPLRVLINVAYPSQTNEIVNAPDWVTRENYDVTALAGPSATLPQVIEMMKTLLADRMRLVAHYETRERPVYELVTSSPGGLGPNLRRSAVDCDALATAARARNEAPQPPPPTGPLPPCYMRGPNNGTMEATAWSMENLAVNLRFTAGRVVLNRTGLDGLYDLTVNYAPDAANTADTRPSLFTALQEQQGLTLRPATAPLQVLVIDRIDRPSEN